MPDTHISPVDAPVDTPVDTLVDDRTEALALPDLGPVKFTSIPGPVPDLRWIAFDCLVIDRSYQREFNTRRGRAHIRKIAAGFNWSSVQALNVSDRGEGIFAVVDGQHTLGGMIIRARQLGDIGDKAPCIVGSRKTVSDEAASFVSLNQNRLAPSALQIHAARLQHGDPLARRMEVVTASADVRILRYPLSPAPVDCTMAVDVIRRAVEQHGDALLIRALRAIRLAFPDTPAQLKTDVIKGVIAVLTHNPAPTDDALIGVMKSCGDMNNFVLHARADARRIGESSGKLVAARLLKSCGVPAAPEIKQKPGRAPRTGITLVPLPPLPEQITVDGAATFADVLAWLENSGTGCDPDPARAGTWRVGMHTKQTPGQVVRIANDRRLRLSPPLPAFEVFP